MPKEAYKLGKFVKLWSEHSQSVAFIVTEDCNLRCKYCYISHKASNKVLALDTAKKFIDYLFTDAVRRQPAVTIDFIGGEPCIEMSLVDQISDYFKIRAYEERSDWYWNYRISICTNGVNYSSKEVQNFIAKNQGKLSMTISIDGTKEKHDAQRVFPNGEGSYDVISESLPLYISQFGGHTKATFSRDDLPNIKESIISLWDVGITDIAANVIFEDVWEDGDDLVFEEQLKDLADYALDNHLFEKYICTFFHDYIGYFYNREDLEKTWCGAGKMLAIGPSGNIYPCIRYKDYSLNKQQERTFGNINDKGIDMDLVRPFLLSQIRFQSDTECLNCDVAIGCAFCQGFNYDEAEIPTNLFRAKYICPMHKARVRANDYYFSKLFNMYGIERENLDKPKKQLYFLLDNDYVSYCQSVSTIVEKNSMSSDAIVKGLRFARENFFMPVFVHSSGSFAFKNLDEFGLYHIHHIVPATFCKEAFFLRDVMFVFEVADCGIDISGLDHCQLNISSSEISQLLSCVKLLLKKAQKVTVNILNLNSSFDEVTYLEQLTGIAEHLNDLNRYLEDFYMVNLFEDIILESCKKLPSHRGCSAGDRTFVYAPDGHLYICAAQYEAGEEIGTLDEGIVRLKYPHLYKLENKPLCNECDAYQCSKCMVINEKYTKERTISPSFQCRKSMIEKDATSIYLKLRDSALKLTSISDPMSKVVVDNENYTGIYKY